MTSCCGAPRPPRTTLTAANAVPPGGPVQKEGPRPDGLVQIPAGTFTMGTDDPSGYTSDGEAPAHLVELGHFSIAAHAVTNAEFAEFIATTGQVTSAEQFGNSFVFGGQLPHDFPPTRGLAAAPWWRQVDGADWRHPEGPHSDISTRSDHPVVHVSWIDAVAYCNWRGARLPTEAEWERAARGALGDGHYPWGDEREPGGRHLMNVFQGEFPGGDTGADGWIGTCPVRSYPANSFGLFEMTGNVWEWCADWHDPAYYSRSPRSDPTGPEEGEARVMRGGSYLCHESYCWRYRVDARSSNTPDSATGNLGFRIAAAWQ